MNILLLIQKLQRRGAETFALQLAHNLKELGHEVTVVSLFKGSIEIAVPFNLITLDRPASARFFDLKGYMQISKIIASRDIQIVQANAGDTLKYAILSKILFRWKAKAVFRNASTVSRYIKNPMVKLFNKWLYGYVDHIVSVAEFTKMDLVQLFPETRDIITVIPIGVEFKNYPPLEPKKYDIIHIGGMSFEKNHAGLISIYNRVKAELPNVKLLLIGDGPLREEVESIVRKYQYEGFITFTGSVEDTLLYLRHAKILVLPSIIEGLPAVILEAFMCRVPVVVYGVGGVSEIVQDNITGKLIPVKDEDQFSQSIIEILRYPEKFTLMTDNAFVRVRESFDNKKLTKRFETLYQSMLRITNGKNSNISHH